MAAAAGEAEAVTAAVAVVEGAMARVLALLRSDVDPGRPVVGSTWTVGEVAAHLASGALAYRSIVVEGRPSPYERLADRVEISQARLEAQLGRDLGSLADVVASETPGLVQALAALPPGTPVAWHGGIELLPRAVLGALAGEFLFHGLDLARTLGAPWTIERRDAWPVVDFFLVVAPHMLAQDRWTRPARYNIRFRGYRTATFELADGALTITGGPVGRADVHISVDPVAFLSVAYGRTSLASALVTGGALAWGRRPWLAFGFPALFQAP